MQLIYINKANQSLLKQNLFQIFPKEKHCSNETETLKLRQEVVLSYIENKRKNVGFPERQKVFLI